MGLIDLEIREKIAIITLNKQPLNICDRYFYTEIACFMEALNVREDFNVVVLRSGCRHFCAGGDLGEIRDMIYRRDIDFTTLVAKSCTRAMESLIDCKSRLLLL